MDSVITKPKMFVMTGTPGAGKTTFAKRFARATGYRYIGIDDFYKHINGDEKIREHKFDVWTECFRIIHLMENDGRSIIVDTNAPNEYERSDFIRWFSGFEHHLIWIDAESEFCIANNLKRDRVVPEDDMERLLSVYVQPGISDAFMWNSITRFSNTQSGFSSPPYYTYPYDIFNKNTPKELKEFDPNEEVSD